MPTRRRFAGRVLTAVGQLIERRKNFQAAAYTYEELGRLGEMKTGERGCC